MIENFLQQSSKPCCFIRCWLTIWYSDITTKIFAINHGNDLQLKAAVGINWWLKKSWKVNLNSLTDTGENRTKWPVYFRLVARTRWKKREENSVDNSANFACEQVSSPRLYRLKLWFSLLFYNIIKNYFLSLAWQYLIGILVIEI